MAHLFAHQRTRARTRYDSGRRSEHLVERRRRRGDEEDARAWRRRARAAAARGRSNMPMIAVKTIIETTFLPRRAIDSCATVSRGPLTGNACAEVPATPARGSCSFATRNMKDAARAGRPNCAVITRETLHMNRFWSQAPVTEIAQRINDLSALLLVVIPVIMAIVFGIMIWSIGAHRRSVGHAAATFLRATGSSRPCGPSCPSSSWCTRFPRPASCTR